MEAYRTFLFDILYYVLPGLAILYLIRNLYPKFHPEGKNKSRISVLFVLVMIALTGIVLMINALIWSTAAFFILRG